MTNFSGQEAVADTQPRDGGRASTIAAEESIDPWARGRWWRDAKRRRLLALADVLAAAFATLVAVAVTGSPWAFVFLPLWPLIAKLLGLYDRDHRALRHLTADEVPAIVVWASISSVLIALFLPLTPAGQLDWLAIAALFFVATATAVCLRSLTRHLWWKYNPPERVGLIGDEDVMESLRRKFHLFRNMPLQLTTERRIAELGEGDARAAQLRDIADRVDRVVLAATNVEADLIGDLKELCHRRQVKLSVVSPLRGRALPSERFSQVADLPILEYNTWDLSRSSLVIKRMFDILVSGASLLISAPLMIVCAIVIKLDTPGPVIFSQIRAGLDGRPFRMFKLRTMAADAEAKLAGLVDIDELDEPVFKLRHDPRITRAGLFLRRFSIDEIPQLLNVLLGEMSIVGPRPEQVELVERYSPAQRVRLTVKPGVTGPMQVFGRGELTLSERLAVEIEYVENPSLDKDLRILIHTLPAVLRGNGAY